MLHVERVNSCIFSSTLERVNLEEIIKSLDCIVSLEDDSIKKKIFKLLNLEYKNEPCVEYIQAMLLDGFSNSSKEKIFYEKYYSLLENSANKGCNEAQYIVANKLYDAGKFLEALKLYEESANSGYAPSQWCYGLDNFSGIDGVLKPDIEKGLTYITYSAGQLYAYAVEFLIDIYTKGYKNIEPDESKAEFYKRMLNWELVY